MIESGIEVDTTEFIMGLLDEADEDSENALKLVNSNETCKLFPDASLSIPIAIT